MTTKQAESRQSRRQKQQNKQQSVKTSSAHVRKRRRVRQKTEKRNNKIPRRRIFPIWLRLIVLIILCVLALAAGLMIGYGILGDGVPKDALKVETWKHIIDLVKGE